MVALATSVLFIPQARSESKEIPYVCGLALTESGGGLPIGVAELEALAAQLDGLSGPVDTGALGPLGPIVGGIAENLPGGNADADSLRGALQQLLALANLESIPATAKFDSKVQGQQIKVGEFVETRPISGVITFGQGLPEQLPAFEVPVPAGDIEMAGSVQRPNRVEDYPMTFAGDKFVLNQQGGLGNLSTGEGANIVADVAGTYELRAGEMTFSLVNKTLKVVTLFVCMPDAGADLSIDSFSAVAGSAAPAPPAPPAPAPGPEIVPAAAPAAPERPSVVQTDAGQNGLPSWLPLVIVGALGLGAIGAAYRLTRVSSVEH